MLESYKVVKENHEEVLYMYLSMKYEFADELNNYNLDEKTTSWLCNERIQFNGNKVVLVVDGIKTKTIYLNKNKYYSDLEAKVTLANGEVITIHDLLLSLLFSNIKLTLPFETLKAVVVLYRSNIIKLLNGHSKIPLTTKHFSYTNYNYYKLSYPLIYQSNLMLFERAIMETQDQYLIYNNIPIEAYIHIASNGYTEEASNIPYLARKESFWDLAYPYYLQQKFISLEELKNKLNLPLDKDYNIQIIHVSNGNRIKKIKIGPKIFTDQDLMVLLGLPSSDATILVEKNGFRFITRGIGNGYGLSLVGAKALANLGCNYKQILNYYFKDIVLVIKESKTN